MSNIEDCQTPDQTAQFIRDEINAEAQKNRNQVGVLNAKRLARERNLAYYASAAHFHEPHTRLNIMQAVLILMTETT